MSTDAPLLKTSLPGPKAAAIIARDKASVSPSYTRDYPLVMAGGHGALAPPEVVRRVGIGTRVRMVFTDVTSGLALPQWTIDEGAPQPDKPWRYPQE